MTPVLVKTLMLSASSALMMALTALPAEAWADHRGLTREILADVTWLSEPQYRQITVTPYQYEAEDRGPYAAGFQPIYVDRLVGEKTTAREILLRYVDEPDWGMDAGLSISPLQALAGGSKGFRHQRYYYLGGLVRVGNAPQRADHFYKLSKLAFRRGDAYWGFRFLARSLHYLEDMGQPLHTRAFFPRQLAQAGFNPETLRTRAANTHHYYEAWVAHQLAKQQRSGAGNWVQAIREADVGTIRSVKDATKALATYSYKNSSALLEANLAYWPKRVTRSEAIGPIDSRLLDPPKPPEGWEKLNRLTANALHVTAKVAKGFLAYAYRDAIAQPRPRDPDAGWGGLTDLD